MKPFEKKGWYRLALPDHWEVDEEEDPVALYDPDGAGALHVGVQSPPLRPGDSIDPSLFMRAFLKQSGVKFKTSGLQEWERGALRGARYEFTSGGPEGDLFERLWFVTKRDFLVFLTYTCRKEEDHREREVIDRMIESLELIG